MNVDLFDLRDKVVVSCMALDKDLVTIDIETFKGNRVSVYFKSNRLQDFINSLEAVCVQLRGMVKEPKTLAQVQGARTLDNVSDEELRQLAIEPAAGLIPVREDTKLSLEDITSDGEGTVYASEIGGPGPEDKDQDEAPDDEDVPF